MAVTATAAAVDHITRHLQKRGKGKGIRVGVKTSGCSGMAYVLEYVDEESQDDHAFEIGEYNIYVDPKSLVYLDGTELDFVKDGFNEGFEFKNPNVKDECGCGESFNV